MRRRTNKGYVPHQSKFSPQDINDVGTPHGTAMLNEELRRLRQALDDVQAQAQAIEAQIPKPEPKPEKPDKETPPEKDDDKTAISPLTVKKNGATVVRPTDTLNFLDSATTTINVSRPASGRADISVRAKMSNLSVYWGCEYPTTTGGVVGGQSLSFFDTKPNSRRHPTTNVEMAPYRAALPIGWEATAGSTGAVITGYAKHNNLSVVVDANRRGQNAEVITKLSTNVLKLADTCDVKWSVDPIEREPIERACERDGVQISATITCDISRTDTPLWRTGATTFSFNGLAGMMECGPAFGVYEAIAFSSQTIDRPCNFKRPYYVSGGVHYWRFYAQHECGVYNVHAFLTMRTDEALAQNLMMYMVLARNGTMYSVLDSNKDLYTIESIVYPDYDATNGAQTFFNLEGEDDIVLRRGEYVEIGFIPQEMPIIPEVAAYTIQLLYGYVNVRYIGSCGEEIATTQSVSNAAPVTC